MAYNPIRQSDQTLDTTIYSLTRPDFILVVNYQQSAYFYTL